MMAVVAIVEGVALVVFTAVLHQTTAYLNSLRQTCFLTDERGVRVKYYNASQRIRDKAEGK